jgi:hypothetical protein
MPNGTAIFSSMPGRIVAIDADSEAQTFNLKIQGDASSGGKFENSGFVTTVELREKVLAQFQTTLDKSLFAIPFGDDVGMMSVGLVHGKVCGVNGAETTDTVKAIQAWYGANKFQNGRLNPLTLAIGENVYAGYLLELALNAQAHEGTVVRSQLQFAAWSMA